MLIINAFKKTTSASRLLFLVGFLFIDEGGNSANGMVVFVYQDPSVAFAKAKKIVFLGIKYGFDVIQQRTYPLGIIPVNGKWEFKELFCNMLIRYFYCLHCFK